MSYNHRSMYTVWPNTMYLYVTWTLLVFKSPFYSEKSYPTENFDINHVNFDISHAWTCYNSRHLKNCLDNPHKCKPYGH